MNLKFPLLKGKDHFTLPSKTGNGCIICQTNFQKGFAYLSAGAVAETTLVDSDLLEASSISDSIATPTN